MEKLMAGGAPSVTGGLNSGWRECGFPSIGMPGLGVLGMIETKFGDCEES